jgi:hypothetical protein
MVNVNNLTGKERLLISLRNSGEVLPEAVVLRVTG